MLSAALFLGQNPPISVDPGVIPDSSIHSPTQLVLRSCIGVSENMPFSRTAKIELNTNLNVAHNSGIMHNHKASAWGTEGIVGGGEVQSSSSLPPTHPSPAQDHNQSKPVKAASGRIEEPFVFYSP